MRTETAIVFNKKSGHAEEMTATEFENLFRGNKPLGINPVRPGEEEHLIVTSPNDDIPLTFRRSHYRNGEEEFVQACWVRPEGFGDDNHIFNHNTKAFKNAVLSGKAVLLSLNLKMASRPISFRNMSGHGAQNLEKWATQRQGSYITVSINSVEDTIKTLKRTHELAGNIGNRIFAVHRGAVVPFRNFFVGTESGMVGLYNDMHRGVGGVASGNERIIGFPRLMPFLPTHTTIESAAKKGLKGNYIKAEKGKPYLTQLVFDGKAGVRDTDPYKILEDNIINDPQAVYVLAIPSISCPVDMLKWKHMRLNIKNIPAQIFAIDPEAKEKLLRHRKLHGKDDADKRTQQKNDLSDCSL